MELIRKTWQIYVEFEQQDFLVKPSLPVLFFGNSEQYFTSKLKVVTLGLNPSLEEFPADDPYARFAEARELDLGRTDRVSCDAYLRVLNGYFFEARRPYKQWFNSFEPLLSGLGCSYYGQPAESTSLHTDLCSPLATNPTWSHLPRMVQERLFQAGAGLWHSLIEWLSPDLIIASLARQHIIDAFPSADWKVVHTVERPNPYSVELAEWKLLNGKITRLVFGKAAQTPFGTLSRDNKRAIGRAILGCLDGAARPQTGSISSVPPGSA